MRGIYFGDDWSSYNDSPLYYNQKWTVVYVKHVTCYLSCNDPRATELLRFFMSKSMLVIIALWWWFCPCRVGGAVWNHTAWLFPLMPLPTEFLFYSYFLSRNKYKKNITCKNIGQFHFCINLLPLALIWRSAPCLKHWNQRWFGDAAFTIPSGKQWDHMSPWSPSWLSAGIDECCRSANESGHQWFKRVG